MTHHVNFIIPYYSPDNTTVTSSRSCFTVNSLLCMIFLF